MITKSIMSGLKCKLQVYCLVVVVILMSMKMTEVEAELCLSDNDCTDTYEGARYCCMEYRYSGECDYDCVGKLCTLDSDCSPRQRCYDSKCKKRVGECESYEDCSSWPNLYCCKGTGWDGNTCSSNCLGKSCRYGSDCSPGEHCHYSKCKKKDWECESDEDCSSTPITYCCERTAGLDDNTCSSNCLGKSCRYNSDCAPGERCEDLKCTKNDGQCLRDEDCILTFFCCERTGSDDNICATSCSLSSCNKNSDCAPKECCDNHQCTSSGCHHISGGRISLIVIGIIIFIMFVSFACYCYCKARVIASSRRAGEGDTSLLVADPASTAMASENSQSEPRSETPYSTQTYPMQAHLNQEGPPPGYSSASHRPNDAHLHQSLPEQYCLQINLPEYQATEDPPPPYEPSWDLNQRPVLPPLV